jgi:hypothetical protein
VGHLSHLHGHHVILKRSTCHLSDASEEGLGGRIVRADDGGIRPQRPTRDIVCCWWLNSGRCSHSGIPTTIPEVRNTEPQSLTN